MSGIDYETEYFEKVKEVDELRSVLRTAAEALRQLEAGTTDALLRYDIRSVIERVDRLPE